MKEMRLKAQANRVFLYCDCGGFTAPTGTMKGYPPVYGNKCDLCHKIIWTAEQYPYTEIIYNAGDIEKIEIDKCERVDDEFVEMELEQWHRV